MTSQRQTPAPTDRSAAARDGLAGVPQERSLEPPPIAGPLLEWFGRHGRTDLPWQGHDPYRIWVSEIMLQQTQVATVVPYFQRFLASFPDVPALAAAPLDRVLHLWSGLGYYARGRNLHAAAQIMVARHGGRVPADFELLQTLPGIGRSTAAAIVALAWQEPRAILDGNVKRVLGRYHALAGWPQHSAVNRRYWALAQQHTDAVPTTRVAAYTQAIMDLGATVCRRHKPACTSDHQACPLSSHCRAHRQRSTDQYPQRKPRRELPTQETTLLFIRHGSHLLLRQRPPAGIWGGLWCPPELPHGADLPDGIAAAQWCQQHLGREPLHVEPLANLTHPFTHFRLHITALLCHLPDRDLPLPGQRHTIMEGPDTLWYNSAEPAAIGLPAPVKSLLDRVPQICARQQ